MKIIRNKKKNNQTKFKKKRKISLGFLFGRTELFKHFNNTCNYYYYYCYSSNCVK